MTTPLDRLSEKLRELATGWTSYTAFGSFLLYVVGYLTLRFHLTALGVGTDLAVLDERYLFTRREIRGLSGVGGANRGARAKRSANK